MNQSKIAVRYAKACFEIAKEKNILDIVKIDIETGKVLEEIDMSGLIDMYHNQKDRIDYLNGIAYDAVAGTGAGNLDTNGLHV